MPIPVPASESFKGIVERGSGSTPPGIKTAVDDGAVKQLLEAANEALGQ
jgi:hypothetical protein